MSQDEAEGPFISYDCGENIGAAVFIRRCSVCSLFVKADDEIFAHEETGLKKAPNATCKKCGRVEMDFQGFF